jgi:two-component system NarL family sensor kinase
MAAGGRRRSHEGGRGRSHGVGAGIFVYSVETERIVAWLRLPAIALIVAGQQLSNPHDPDWYPSPETGFFVALLVFVAWSIGLLAWVYRRPTSQRFALATTAVDVAAITALTITSGAGLSQTRFAYFFIPVVAAFRFRPFITAIAAAAGVVAYTGQALARPVAGQPAEPRFIAVHAGYLAWVGLAAALLAALLRRRTQRVVDLVESRELLLSELLTVEEREHQALAESLHDNAIQNLLSIRHELEEASADASGAALERADAALMETVSELRRTISTLHPYALEAAGPAAALRLLAEQAARRGGFAVRLDVQEGPSGADDRLLIGAARELLANVASHAEATHVAVRLSHDPREARLTVSDDGIGFDLSQLTTHVADGHIGIASQLVRVQTAGGRMEIVSEPGQGTTVTVRLPRTEAGSAAAAPPAGESAVSRGDGGTEGAAAADRSGALPRGSSASA